MGIQDELPWSILFADDIVLIDVTRDGANWSDEDIHLSLEVLDKAD